MRESARCKGMIRRCNRVSTVIFFVLMLTALLRVVAIVWLPGIGPFAAWSAILVAALMSVALTLNGINAFLRIEGQGHDCADTARFLAHALENPPSTSEELTRLHHDLMTKEGLWATISSRSGHIKYN